MYIVEAAKNPIIIKEAVNNIFNNIEKKYSIKIPNKIKNFLIKHSDEKLKVTNIKINNKPWEDFNIRILSFVNPNSDYYFENFVDYFLKGNNKTIPIAETDGGDNIIIDINTGKVYYWLHEFDDYNLIANSLDELYDKMTSK